MSNPLVSIIIPVYNVEQYLSETLDSVILQSYNNWEIIAVDDGSTDKSLTILYEYQKKDQRIKVISQQNCGIPSKARNCALRYAVGDFVFALDSDDWVSSDFIEELVKRQQQTMADCVVPIIKFVEKIDGEYQCIKTITGYYGDLNAVISGHEALIATIDWNIAGIAMWRTSILKTLGFEQLTFNDDELSQREIFHYSNKVAFCKSFLFYRQHSQSVSHDTESLKYYDRLDVMFRLMEFMNTHHYDDACLKKIQSDINNNCKNFYESLLLSHKKSYERLCKQIMIESVYKKNQFLSSKLKKECCFFLKIKIKVFLIKLKYKILA